MEKGHGDGMASLLHLRQRGVAASGANWYQSWEARNASAVLITQNHCMLQRAQCIGLFGHYGRFITSIQMSWLEYLGNSCAYWNCSDQINNNNLLKIQHSALASVLGQRPNFFKYSAVSFSRKCKWTFGHSLLLLVYVLRLECQITMESFQNPLWKKHMFWMSSLGKF